jgi:hypothetical protein
MSSILRMKRRAATGAAGAPASLKNGEVAYNENDNTKYYGYGDDGAGNATSIIPIGGKGAFADLTSAQAIAGIKSFSASPLVPTVTAGDSSTKAASTAFVAAAIGGSGGVQTPNTVYAGPSTGAVSIAPSFRALVALDIPSLLSSKLSDLGSANGAASLDGSGKIPTSQLPASVLGSLKYKGTIAASGALPSSPSVGDYYVISTAGTFTGSTHALKVGDWITYDGGSLGDLGAAGWDYVDNSVAVSSVFGRTGTIVATSGDYNSDQVTEGSTNLYFTVARVLATLLTGLSTVTSTVVAATDSVLVAIGKLQAQVSLRLIASNNLSDLTNAATARASLGLGTMAIQNASAVAIAGGTLDSVTATNIIIDLGTF